MLGICTQSYVIKSPPVLVEDPYPVENIGRLGVLMFQTSDSSQLLRRVLWIRPTVDQCRADYCLKIET